MAAPSIVLRSTKVRDTAKSSDKSDNDVTMKQIEELCVGKGFDEHLKRAIVEMSVGLSLVHAKGAVRMGNFITLLVKALSSTQEEVKALRAEVASLRSSSTSSLTTITQEMKQLKDFNFRAASVQEKHTATLERKELDEKRHNVVVQLKGDKPVGQHHQHIMSSVLKASGVRQADIQGIALVAQKQATTRSSSAASRTTTGSEGSSSSSSSSSSCYSKDGNGSTSADALSAGPGNTSSSPAKTYVQAAVPTSSASQSADDPPTHTTQGSATTVYTYKIKFTSHMAALKAIKTRSKHSAKGLGTGLILFEDLTLAERELKLQHMDTFKRMKANNVVMAWRRAELYKLEEGKWVKVPVEGRAA